MLKSILSVIVAVMVLVSGPMASAEPIKLKLALMFSDGTFLFPELIKPLVDAVNTDARGQLVIEVYSGGVLGKDPAQQAQMVLDGTADIAYVFPSTSARFADNAVIELPGMYGRFPEASRVYTRLLAAGALRGYEDFFAVGAFASEPEGIHSRRPIASLDDLKGQKIRTSSALEAAALAKLGVEPVVMAISEVPDAISSGAIDGAAFSLAPLQERGIARVTSYHYLLPTSASPLALLMNRRKFESLPASSQAIIRRYSGEWVVDRMDQCCEQTIGKVIEQLKADQRRKVVIPTKTDFDRAQVAFTAVVNDWVAKDQRNEQLLRLVKGELAKLRAAPATQGAAVQQ